MRKSFSARALGICSITLFTLFIGSYNLVSQCASGTLGGQIYLDANNNGVWDQGEAAHTGMQVRAYDASGSWVGQAISDAAGQFSISDLTDGNNYRLEYNLGNSYLVSNLGAGNGGDVQFASAPFCDSDLGLMSGDGNCSANTEVFLSCFVNGLGANSPNQETVIGLVNSFNAGSPVNVYARQSETGAVWGIVYNEGSQEIFSSAFVKQHSSLGPGGLGAIYKTNTNGPSTSIFANLTSLGVNVGSLSTTNSDDCNYGNQVGKVGLGGMTTDPGNNFLYVANLNTNSVVQLSVTNPSASTTTSYSVPNPGCNNGDFRVFGLKYYGGSVYVGVTCTGETSGNETDTEIHVYEMNASTGAFSLAFSSSYSRGYWSASNVANRQTMQWLTDIDFTDNGNMILALSDRLGHAYCNGGSSRVDDQYGDILIVENVNGNWVLENNGSISTASGTGIGNGEGPGGGEFFGDDFFPGNPSDHPDVALGSIYVRPGSDEVISAVFDPGYAAYSGGLHRYNTNTGQKVGSRELYNQNIADYFGKATGFGDIHAGCGPTTPQIGNYVWIDTDCDGMQDAGEPALTFANISLYDSNCNLISTTQTDANGNYSFSSGISVGTQYYVALDPASFNSGISAYDIDDVVYTPTISNSTAGLNSDLQFSQLCPALNGLPVISVLPNGRNNITFDIGLKPSTEFDLALMKINKTPDNNEFGDIVEFELQVYNQGTVAATSFELVDYLTTAYRFDPSLNPGWVLSNGILRNMINTTLLPGQDHYVSLFLELVGSANLDDLINYAEISYTMDINGVQDSDVDSTTDDRNGNDVGGVVASSTDDLITGVGILDEDDHDPAMIYIFDLALSKVNRNLRAYDAGETVVFDITVCNQGNVDALDFQIADNYPVGLSFSAASNPGWSVAGPQLVTYDYNQTLAVGGKVTIPVRFTIAEAQTQQELMNYAEISDFTSAVPSIIDDFDSQPDTDMTNDVGGIPQSATDDLILDHGVIDEDDHDPASVRIRAVDLALVKRVAQTSYNLGDQVTFEIEIFNQGSAHIGRIELVDFLPANTTLADNAWTLDASGARAFKNVDFLSGLAPGQSYIDNIVLKIDADAPTGAFLNYAEISKVWDVQNYDISNSDIDSTPDDVMGNDAGGQPVTAMDDYILGNGNDDEDDSDPAMVFVPTIELSESCTCLRSATSAHDGQFREEIKITSVSGENWYIDFEYEFYSTASTPGNNVSYPTGPTGKQFIEQPNGDGTSSYILKGKSVDNNAYTLRATNGWGVFLSVTGGDCDYCTPIVLGDGLGAVCANSTHTYTVDTSDPKYDDCIGFSWFLSGGPGAGTIVNMPGTNATGSGTGMTGSGTGPGNSITIDWGAGSGPHDLILIPHCPNDCVSPVNLQVSVGMEDEAMSCVHEINISLDNGCKSILYPEDLLTSTISPGVEYQLIITDAYGTVVQGNKLTEEHLWTRLMAKVMNPCSGNSCWAFINVEDKLPPQIQCDDIEVKCSQMHNYEPLVLDNCSTSEYRLVSETTVPLPCTADYIKEIHRTYVAEDGYGNVSQPCTQKINVLPVDLDAIEIPIDYTIKDENALSCAGLELDDQGNPLPSLTGVPSIGGLAIYPVTDLYCNIGVDYRDVVVVDFGCSKKIMRTWTVYDGCKDPLRRVQTIEIADIRAPWVDCPANVTVNTDGTPGCDTEYTIPMPQITDDCTVDNFIVDIRYASGFLQNVNGAQTVTLSAADDTGITYNVYDECGNESTCTYNVTILDNVTPTAVCDRNSVVSLRLDGTAKAFPQTFDDGSYDDCDLFKTLVRRMDSPCECERPRYDDMSFLGERNGRFYYLSSFERPCFKAFSYSTAYGGALLTLESKGEHDWVYEQVNNYLPGTNYYIGLKDKNGTGAFTWDNHAEPNFNVWSGGSPTTDGECVVVNGDGEWQSVGDIQARFVLEVANPCGFSEEVSFCCADVGQPSMVVLRAIDYFGGYNDCMVSIEVQDKVPPVLTCPADVVLDCAAEIDLNNLTEYGEATASDRCVVNVSSEVFDSRSQCGTGTVIRRFVAADANGTSTCDQVINFTNDAPFDFASVIVPQDFDTDLGCNFGALHPDNLPAESAYPIYPTDACDIVEGTFEDQVFSFAGAGTDACLKILRKWTVIDWCQLDADGLPRTEQFDQTIKVMNTEGPEIVSGQCDTLIISTLECDNGAVNFSVQAHDDCTPDAQLQNCIRIDLNSDGTFDLEDCLVSNVASFNNKLPLGHHTALVSFSDLCGNTTTCSKEIWIKNEKPPVAYCKSGLSVALEPMDLDGDGVPDDEMACIFPHMLDLGSTHPCGSNFGISFCNNDPTNKITFDCTDIGVQLVTLCVIDEFGNSASCQTTVEVQDNNNGDFCPEFDLAIIKEVVSGTGDYNPGDTVKYRITVFNQGNIDAIDTRLIDYIPPGLQFIPGLNPGWTGPDANGDVNYTSMATIPANPFGLPGINPYEIVCLYLRVDPTTMETCLVNEVEISASGNPNFPSYSDIDSHADNIIGNDVVKDNVITEDGYANSDQDEDDHDIAKINVRQFYDLALSKDITGGDASPYQPGDNISYTITVTNQGTLDATTVDVQDDIPVGLILNDPNWSVIGGNAILNNSIPFIGARTSQTVTINFTIDPTFMGSQILNDAQIIDRDGSDPSDIDSDTATGKNVDEDGDGDGDDDDEDWVLITLGQSFDLALTKVVSSASPYLLGDVVTFDITVFNQGTLDATNVEVTDYVPAGFNYVNGIFNSTAGWSTGPNPSNTVGSINAGSSSTIQIQLEIDPTYTGNTIVNNAEITAADNALNLADEDSTPGDNQNTPSELGTDNDVNDTPDNPNDSDDYDPAEVTVDRYDLALTKNISTATPGPYVQGSTVTYDIVVANEGTLDATTVYVEDDIPEGLNLIDSNWTIVGGAARLITPIALIPGGGTSSVSITFEIDMAFMGTTILNDAQIIDPDNSDRFDVDSDTATDKNIDEDGDGDGDDDDEDWAMISLGQTFDLALRKVVTAGGPATYQTGDLVSFDITVFNQGSIDATNVVVTDYVRPNMIYDNTFGGNSANGWSVGPNPTNPIGSVPSGTSRTVTIQLMIDPNFTGTQLLNDAEITNASNALGLADEDSTPNDNSGTPSETGTDNDVSDAPDNPNDNDDYDPAEIMVECVLEPICDVLSALEVVLDNNGNATISADDINVNSRATCDGLDVTLSLSRTNFACADKGAGTQNIVTVTVTDGQGNVSNDPNCATQITVVDNIDPFITCQNITTTLDANGNPIIDLNQVVLTSGDNCGIANTVLTPPANVARCVTNNASVTVTDICGNTASCTFQVSIEDEAPVARCVADFDLCLDASGNASLTAAMIDDGSTDDCGIAQLAIDQLNFDCDDVGPKVITLVVMDNNAVPQTDNCTTIVTIIDKTPPSPICQSITVEVAANGSVGISALQIDNGSNDACGLAANPFALSVNTFSCDNKQISNTTILTVTDANGNTATCAASVNVIDNIDPTITCRPANFVNLDSNGQFTIDESFVITSSGDNCPNLTTAIDRTTFSCIDKANIVVVTATATDISGNTATCQTDITVRDLLAPTCTLLSGQVFNVVGAPPEVTIELSDIFDTFLDNCASAPSNVVISPNNFSCVNLGLNTVTATMEDDCGNSTSCSTQITVQDVSEPTCEVIPDVTLNLGTNGMVTIRPEDINISSTAGCDPNATLTVTPSSLACNQIPLSPICVVLTVTGSNGNSATCKSNVSVVDTIPPAISCQNNLVLQLGASGNVTINADDIITSTSDNCPGETRAIDITSFDCSDKPGPVIVTATVTDDSGNSSTCTTSVTLEDNVDPVCTLATGLSFDLIGTPPSITITAADVLATYTDNCGATAASATVMPATFDCSSVGPQAIVVTVTDDCNNSSTCTTSVNIADTSEPTCITQDITVCLDSMGTYMLLASEVDNGSNAGCGTNVNLSVSPSSFNCNQLGMRTVTLTVTTSGGNSSTCTSVVTVEDKIDPVLTCPADVTVACGDPELNDLDNFGTASVFDNCPNNLGTLFDLRFDTLNVCGLGTITRVFNVSEDGEFFSCTQVLTVSQIPAFTSANITCPPATATLDGCIDLGNIYAGSPIIDITGLNCVNISVDSTLVDLSPQTTGVCVDTFLKTWTILDECTGSLFLCEQNIILDDAEGPEINCTDVEVFLPPNFTDCEIFVDLPVTIIDSCSMNPTGTNDSPFADDNTIANAAGTYPGGETIVTITASDNCGNDSTCEYAVTVLDTSASFVSCKKIIETIQPAMGGNPPMGIVDTSQACVVIDSNCPSSIFSLSFDPNDPTVVSFTVDCNDAANPGGIVPGGYTVYLWVGNILLDSCSNFLQVLDGAGHCTSPAQGEIVGSVFTEDDRMISEVMVDLQGSNMNGYMTDDHGHYAFGDVAFGSDYIIVPEKDKDHLNGVSTLDLVMIQRHVLGLEHLDSPYKLIAADVNKSDGINGIDLVELRKLILGLYPEFPNNTSWRMVDAGHEFFDPLNPFYSTIPESYTIIDLESQMEVDFVGVKIGDVNQTAITQVGESDLTLRSSSTFEFMVSEEKHVEGNIVELPVKVNDYHRLEGFQFTLEVNPSFAQIIDVSSSLESFSEGNYNLSEIDKGLIHMSWNDARARDSQDQNTEIFTLRVKLLEDAETSDILSIYEEGISPEAYLDRVAHPVSIDYQDVYENDQVELFQNSPNPWSMYTEISYYLPNNDDVTLKIYDVDGKLVRQLKREGSRGNNTIILDKEDLATGGIYYYELITNEAILVEKMILIK